MKHVSLFPRLLMILLSSGCAGTSTLPDSAGFGPAPLLPEPEQSALPVFKVFDAVGWPENEKPVPAPGLKVEEFAGGLDHPRWLFVLPNGDVLVAESNAPESASKKGMRAALMAQFKKRAGGATKSANRITLLRRSQGGKTEKHVFLEKLHSPFGMALIGNDFYVANTDAVLKFRYRTGATSIRGKGEKIVDLPAGPLNHHWTKDLIASLDGKKLFATVGSNSNIAENGMEKEESRAAVLEIDVAKKSWRVFASGLRNPNGLAWEPVTKKLWVNVNERDELGSDLVPDYMTSVREGGFYGWPYSYYGQHVDARVQPQREDLVARALVPDYALGSHTASLGLAFYDHELLGPRFKGGAIIGQHGSWNRQPASGYKVILVPFADGKPNGPPLDVLSGFLRNQYEAYGRPVGVAVDKEGALLVADDTGNKVWRVTPQ